MVVGQASVVLYHYAAFNGLLLRETEVSCPPAAARCCPLPLPPPLCRCRRRSAAARRRRSASRKALHSS